MRTNISRFARIAARSGARAALSRQQLLNGNGSFSLPFEPPRNTRSMVMITNTKASEIPLSQIPDPVDGRKAFEDVATDDIRVTGACLSRVHTLISKKDDPSQFYLRVYVDPGGCSGFQYKFELTDEEILEDEDIIFGEEARVVVDTGSLDLIRGSTIDFVQEMIKSSFVVSENPQSESACGCGSSFAVKNFASNPAID